MITGDFDANAAGISSTKQTRTFLIQRAAKCAYRINSVTPLPKPWFSIPAFALLPCSTLPIHQPDRPGWHWVAFIRVFVAIGKQSFLKKGDNSP